jgi:molybdenum cofactor biosynthesis enzyme MoaA
MTMIQSALDSKNIAKTGYTEVGGPNTVFSYWQHKNRNSELEIVRLRPYMARVFCELCLRSRLSSPQ